MSLEAANHRQEQLAILQKSLPSNLYFKEKKFDDREMEILTDCLKTNKSNKFKTVTFDGVLDNQSLIKLAKSLETNYTLESVTISNIPDLDISGVEAITRAFIKNKRIKNFNFSGNQLGCVEGGAAKFSEIINKNLILKTIDLSSNKLNDKDADIINHEMKSNTILTEVSLHNNINKDKLCSSEANIIIKCSENAKGIEFYTSLSTVTDSIRKFGESSYNNKISNTTGNSNLSISNNTSKLRS